MRLLILVLETNIKMAELAGSSYAGGDMLRLAVDSQSAERFSNLQKGSELPMDDLLNIYNYPVRQTAFFAQNCHVTSSPYSCCYGVSSSMSDSRLSACLSADNTNETTYSSSEEEILSNQDLTLDKDEIARDLLLSRNEGHDRETSVSDLITVLDMRATQPDLGGTEATSSQLKPPAAVTSSCSSLVEAEGDSSDEEDSENDSTESDDCDQKTIPIGPEHQAQLPDLIIASQRNVTINCGDEHLLWDPSKLPEEAVEGYCAKVVRRQYEVCQNVANLPVKEAQVKDNEQALYLLLQCGYDTDEALRRHYMQISPPADPLSLWSSEESVNFVNGLRLYGKDFYLIQQNKVKTRSVAELVQFYYLWKRTDQYAAFNSKNFSDKKKSNNTSNSYAVTSISDRLHTDVVSIDVGGMKCPNLAGDSSTSSTYSQQGSSPSWLSPPGNTLMTNYSHLHHHPAVPFNPASVYSNVCVPPDQTSVQFNGFGFASTSASSYADGFLDPSCYCSPYHSNITPTHLDYYGADSLDQPPFKKLCHGLSPANCLGTHMISPAEFHGGSFEYSPPVIDGGNSLPFGQIPCQGITGDSSFSYVDTSLSSCLYVDSESVTK